MSPSAASRPAHRPSRRTGIVAAAVDLFKVQPPEIVTVADIADRAGMTSAAFYYHFASKEELLEELVETFAETWVAAVTSRLQATEDVDHLGDFTDSALDWVEDNQSEALVFFSTAVGATAAVDQCRATTRERIIDVMTTELRRLAPSRTPAKTEASAVGLFVLIYVSARSQLTTDEVFVTLGRSRFRREVRVLASSVVVSSRTPKAQPATV
ncbi:MAG TPA: helix-turn-helix domain-containing protein [Kineosporiaceae bacterium]|nr:helix-turn-helix domain-containing protein [Kineosporiaceae bacterium]